MNYYVYAYLDPREPGAFTYNNLNFSLLFKPFYIGKGKENRYLRHLIEHKYTKNKLKMSKISKIQNEFDMKQFIVLVATGLSSESACDLEISLIKTIGRIDLKTGPLTNLTNGGEGRLKSNHSDETKQKISLSKIGKKRSMFSEQWKANISKANAGTNYRPVGSFKHSAKTKADMSISRSGKSNANAKKYIFISPEKLEYYIIGEFENFCNSNNLSVNRMRFKINKGVIIARQKNSLKDEQSANCEGWEVKEV